MDNYVDFDITVTEFISAIRKEYEKSWIYETRNRPCSGIVLFYKGVVDYKDRDVSFRITPNTVVWLPKGQSYTFTSVGDEDVGFIGLSFLAEGCDIPFRMQRIPAGNKEIAGLFDEAMKLAPARDGAYALAIKSKIYWILFMLVRMHVGDPELGQVACDGLGRSVDYIRKHLSEKISQKHLAAISGYSQSYYRKRFAAEYGISPVAYINQKRIEKAERLLLGGLQTKSEIAQACGFENQQFFAKVFKKYTGKTPSEYCKTFELRRTAEAQD